MKSLNALMKALQKISNEDYGKPRIIHQSSISESIYISFSQYLIRYSNHEAKPTYQNIYGIADYEITDYSVHGILWFECINDICVRENITIPSYIKRLITIWNSKKIVTTKTINNNFFNEQIAFENNKHLFPEILSKINHIEERMELESGNKRRRLRQKRNSLRNEIIRMLK